MMSVLEIEEFSSFENITKFLTSVNMPNFIAKYFKNEPKYTAMPGEVGGTVLTFEDAPLEIGVSGSSADLSIFIDFRIRANNDIKLLKFIDRNSTVFDVISNFGPPDFEIDEGKLVKINHNAKVIKYFIDNKYSISFDYNEKIEMVRIFHDKYR